MNALTFIAGMLLGIILAVLLVFLEYDHCQEADNCDDDKAESDLFLVSVKVHTA